MTQVKHPPVQESPRIVPPLSLPLAPHTVVMMVGPTQSGKSTFAEDISLACESIYLTCKVISSDALRIKVLNEAGVTSPESSRHSGLMASASAQAFKLLMSQFETAISYPHGVQVVVLDTTGMDPRFREEVKELTYKAGYKLLMVTFEYKAQSSYRKGTEAESKRTARDIVDYSAYRFRTQVLPNIGRDSSDYRVRITDRSQFGWSLKDELLDETLFGQSEGKGVVSAYAIDKIDLWYRCQYEEASGESVDDPIFAIIGDSHECVAELKALIEDIRKKYPTAVIVHCGDYLDKGGATKEMIDFMLTRIDSGDIVVIGNHENYVAKRLKGLLEPNLRVEQDNFQSVEVLLNDEDYAQKFFKIFDASLPFFIGSEYNSKGNCPFIVTHAPCNKVFLGKVHDVALREQRNYRVKDRTKDIKEELSWFYDEAHWDNPLHLFGHVTFGVSSESPKSLVYKNKVFLDTGAVYGGGLTAAIVQAGALVEFVRVSSVARIQAELPKDPGFRPKPQVAFSLDNYELDFRDQRLINQMTANGIRYISGTMSPAPSRLPKHFTSSEEAKYEIESLRAGLEIFREAGVKIAILQPKFMGSRAQLYLRKDKPEEAFLASRGGWKVKGAEDRTAKEYQEFLKTLYMEYSHLFALPNAGEEIILDGEFLPWHALGKGLIEHAFDPYSALVTWETQQLLESPELKALTEMRARPDALSKYTHVDKFKQVLDSFSGDSKLDFQPFAMLKGPLDNLNAGQQFCALNENEVFIIDLSQLDQLFPQVQEFFENITVEKGMEGVVIKPVEVGEVPKGKEVPPYMKVRSEEYLRLVYGFDYLDKDRYEALCHQKHISSKLSLSIKEHGLGQQMLSSSGDAWLQAVVEMIGEMKKERSLDPRL